MATPWRSVMRVGVTILAILIRGFVVRVYATHRPTMGESCNI